VEHKIVCVFEYISYYNCSVHLDGKTKVSESWFVKVAKWLLLLKYILTAMNLLGPQALLRQIESGFIPFVYLLGFQMLLLSL